MNDYKENEWNREDDLLFTMKQAGWHDKGKPQLCNRLMVRVETTKEVSLAEKKRLIDDLHNFLKERWTNNPSHEDK